MKRLKAKHIWSAIVLLFLLLVIIVGFFAMKNYNHSKQIKAQAETEAKIQSEEKTKKENKKILEQYVNDCWCFFDYCDAEEIYINTSEAFDFHSKEESFGYWIQILDEDYFGGKTNAWNTFQKNTSRRGEFYLKIRNIPEQFSDDEDIKKLYQLIIECKNKYDTLNSLVIYPSSTMTRTEFKNKFDAQTDSINKTLSNAFDLINDIRTNKIYID